MKEFDICDKGIHKMNTVSSLVQVGCLRGVSQMNERRDWFRWTAVVSRQHNVELDLAGWQSGEKPGRCLEGGIL